MQICGHVHEKLKRQYGQWMSVKQEQNMKSTFPYVDANMFHQTAEKICGHVDAGLHLFGNIHFANTCNCLRG